MDDRELTAEEQRLLETLLKHKPVDGFSAQQLAGKAHWRWDRSQHREAAVLFIAASQRAAVEAAAGARDLTMTYLARAAINLHLGGQIERAWPLLERAIDYDWEAAQNSIDDHMIEWCLVAMLQTHAARGDREAFVATFDRALGRHAEIGAPFPRIHPKQELLAELACDLGLVEPFEQVVAQIEAQRGPKLPRKLTRKLADLRQRIATVTRSRPR